MYFCPIHFDNSCATNYNIPSLRYSVHFIEAIRACFVKRAEAKGEAGQPLLPGLVRFWRDHGQGNYKGCPGLIGRHIDYAALTTTSSTKNELVRCDEEVWAAKTSVTVWPA